MLSELQKSGSAFFQSTPRIIPDPKLVEIHLKRDQKVTFDY